MSSSYLILAALVMAGVTFVTRAVPVLIPKKILDKPWLHQLNENLPLAVMVLLILVSLTYPSFDTANSLFDLKDTNTQLFVAQVMTLFMVLALYHFTRQLFICMILGIAILNALLWLISQII